MQSVVDAVWRLAVVAAAVTACIAIVAEQYDGAPTAVLVGALLVVTGAVVNRGWAAAVPLAAAVVWLVAVFLWQGTTFDDTSSETTWALLLVVFGFAAVLATAALGIGVLLRRAVAQSRFSPQNDANGLSLKLPMSR